MPLLIFVAAETGVCVPLPSKLTAASAAIPAFRPCLPSRCLAMDYSVTICFDSQLKQLFPFLVFFFYSTFIIMYPNEQSYMLNDSVNIEKHIKTYLLNTCIITSRTDKMSAGNSRFQGTTRSNSCIDMVFGRNVDNLSCMNYVSYFSYK
jgi:hypothetical protein